MTRATTKIPFSTIRFIDNIPRLYDMQKRLAQKLLEIRERLYQREPDKMITKKMQTSDDAISDAHTTNIKRRATRYLERLHSATWIKNLSQSYEAMLTALRGGLPIARIMPDSRGPFTLNRP